MTLSHTLVKSLASIIFSNKTFCCSVSVNLIPIVFCHGIWLIIPFSNLLRMNKLDRDKR